MLFVGCSENSISATTKRNLRSFEKRKQAGETQLDMNKPKTIGFFSSQLNGEVILRNDKKGEGNQAPLTVHELMLETATKYPDLIALGIKKVNEWETITYIEYYELCRKAAKSLLKLDLERFHGVGILGCNSIEWLVANIASIFAGGISVGIFPQNSPQNCRFIADNSEANIFMVEDDWQLQKILKVQNHLPHLKAIVQLKGKLRKKLPHLYSITWTSAAVLQSLPYTYAPENQEILVSYLPLCLITVQIFEIWIPITIGASIFFAEPDAIKVEGSLINTLREVRPTTFFGIPEVWEEIQQKLKLDQMSATSFKKNMIVWAKKVGLKTNLNREHDAHSPFNFRVAKKLIYERVRRNLGLDRCLQFLSSGAGLSKETQEFFLSYDITLLQIYGMTECTGPHSVSIEKEFKLLSCGKAIPGSNSLLRQKDEDGMGEFFIWGRHISMGYLNNEYKTKKVFDPKGWLHTGDMGILDNEGFIHITGRIEEIIITNEGERIFPVPIEDMLKNNIPIICHAMIVGNQAKFLSVLLTLKCEVNEDTGEPRSILTKEVINFCRRNNSKATKVTDITNNQDPVIDDIIQRGIDEINEQTDYDSHKILKWKVLEKDFSITGGELGPTSKMRRSHITRMYQTTIASFYI
ncbi:long-chain-fatty-acid--CoA ligase ACSBG2-like isoform X3 [Notamacropus eugenii]|uniref:long-chain-fatty-acid--CoA ligase ACSBG2-like isoform X3 n=1 Tax=Notamacropus eugenii TaxID=9315 RepID=UPI003B675414